MSEPGEILQGAEYVIEAVPEAFPSFVRIFNGFECRAKHGENQEQVEKCKKEVLFDK